MKENLEFIEAGPNDWPKCPHCEKEVRQVIYRKRGFLSRMLLFWCPHCKAVLGASNTFNA